MNTRIKWNKNWYFSRQPLTGSVSLPEYENFSWQEVNLPHDWLIGEEDLYKNSEGWYKKELTLTADELSRQEEYLLYFEGVYMDCSIYINGLLAGEWKYGYSSFEVRLTPFLQPKANTVLVRVRHAAPNSRWYSGAGIYRNVWLKRVPALHIATDGIYIRTEKENGLWTLTVYTSLEEQGCALKAAKAPVRLYHRLETPDKELLEPVIGDGTPVTLPQVSLWELHSPCLYRLHTFLETDRGLVQEEVTVFGFRDILLDPEKGFFLNGRHIKLQGVCQHHDLGALGAAVNRSAIRRQLKLLQSMGVNAIRTSHNMPAPQLLELADEMGILIVDEAFDMWERPKTAYDYARFFPEWSSRDVKSWICRDRNHPSVILWSIGNEIYDTHADSRGQELTRCLMEQVALHDPYRHAIPTIGSNYMTWENAQACADIIKIAGYNYTEKLYEQHHHAHPDWVIYGSETSSLVQSRGIYHFPLKQPTLAEDDSQCSSLGNSTTSWGAKSQQFCALAERHAAFSMGQFLWSGFDYIGEPTPYHTRSSYFGQIDTAGFPKDAYYFYQSVWTDLHSNPMVHILPYWDFNPGQLIDIRVYSNAPETELLVNGISQGRRRLEHFSGDIIIADWQVPYEPGCITAIAYDENGNELARDEQHSFGDAVSLRLSADRTTVPADGQELIFITVEALDKDGYPVANANNRIHISVSGEGLLAGLDNGNSVDTDSYKSCSRCLFSGKLLAILAPTLTAGSITVTASSRGLNPASLTLHSTPCPLTEEDCILLPSVPAPAEPDCSRDDIPVRKITLLCEDSRTLTPDHPRTTVRAVLQPADATWHDVIWKITNAAGVEIPNASLQIVAPADTHSAPGEGFCQEILLTGRSDGAFTLRCAVKNGHSDIRLYSQLEFAVSGMGAKSLDPYTPISGSLYDFYEGELSNGNEHGVATARDCVTSVTFSNLDFGPFGSDTVTIPIFELDNQPTEITFIEGKTRENPGTVLGTYVYDKKSIWNVYQEQRFCFPRRLKGITSFTIQLLHKIHIRDICFERQEKAWSTLCAAGADAIYGDSFQKNGEAVTGIGNNVSLEYEAMDFGSEGEVLLQITGRCPRGSNTIHVRMSNENGEELNIAEFPCSKEYTEQSFRIKVLPGIQKVTFLFLPGSCFDLRCFRFTKV